MRARRVGAIVISVVGAAAILGGCSLSLPGIGAPGATDPAPARAQAHLVLDRWAAAVAEAGGQPAVAPVGELTAQVGDWEEAVGVNNKLALMAGMVATVEGLPDDGPRAGEVVWEDGTTAGVPLLSAQDAVVAMEQTTDPSCEDCAMILITDARLTTGPIETTRGPATAPIWEFTLQGTDVKLTRVAVANPVVVAPTEADWQLGLAIDAASGSVAGSEVTVSFIGAPNAGDQGCGEDYTAEAVESDLAVVVIVTRHPHPAPLGAGCTAAGARRTATASLAAPLGDRAVLDFQRGVPVPLEVQP